VESRVRRKPVCNIEVHCLTAWPLASPDDKDNRIKIKRDITINLYQMFTLYNEKYKLEHSHGVAALMELVHKIGMPDFIANNRPNVAI